MFLTGIGTAVPRQQYTPLECWDAMQKAPQFSKLDSRSRSLLHRLLTGGGGPAKRHFAVGELSEGFNLTPDALHRRFTENAPDLAAKAATRALESARLSPSEIDAVLVSTCTGYLCPGLTGYLGERLGLRNEILALDLVGQGCGAALPNLRTAEALLASGRAQNVLSICVEICSAALFLDDDPGVLISACLFGDGAGAAVLSGNPSTHNRRVEWKFSQSLVSPGDRELLRFQYQQGMLRNILSREVPELAARQVECVLKCMLEDSGLDRTDVSGWIVHAGGREVLKALQRRLGFQKDELRLSAEVLQEFGNVSSPFILFVLERALSQNARGGWWWLSTFGAGFSCHGALLDVESR